MHLFRYLAKEVLTVMVAVCVALLLITMSSRFVKYLAQAASGDLAGDVLFSIMAFRVPGFLELILPLALFIGILLAYGRLYVESEMVVLSACGTSQNRLLAYTMAIATFVGLLVGLVSLYLSPWGAEKVQDIFNNPKTYSQVNTVVAGRFQQSESGKRVTYTESVNTGESGQSLMANVFISEQIKGQGGESLIRMVVAEQGKIVRRGNHRYVELSNGYRYQGSPGQLGFLAGSFDHYGQLMLEPMDRTRQQLKVEARSTSALMASDKPEDKAALHWRLSLPLLVPIVAIFALSLSRTDHRRGRYAKLLPALVIYIAYLLLLSAARGSMEDPDADMQLNMWVVHGVFLAGGLLLYYFDNLQRWWLYRNGPVTGGKA